MAALGNVGYASCHATVKVRMSSDGPKVQEDSCFTANHTILTENRKSNLMSNEFSVIRDTHSEKSDSPSESGMAGDTVQQKAKR